MIGIFERSLAFKGYTTEPFRLTRREKINVTLQEHDDREGVNICRQVRVYTLLDEVFYKQFFSDTDAKRYEVCLFYQLLYSPVEFHLPILVAAEVVWTFSITHLWFVKSDVSSIEKLQLDLIGGHAVVIHGFFVHGYAAEGKDR